VLRQGEAEARRTLSMQHVHTLNRLSTSILQHWWQNRCGMPLSVSSGAFWCSGQMPQRWLKTLHAGGAALVPGSIIPQLTNRLLEGDPPYLQSCSDAPQRSTTQNAFAGTPAAGFRPIARPGDGDNVRGSNTRSATRPDSESAPAPSATPLRARTPHTDGTQTGGASRIAACFTA
jgi:hypothetical protein